MKKTRKKAVNAEGLLTIKGAADRTALTRAAIDAAIRRGELTAYPTDCGGTNLLLTTDVDAWIKIERKPGRKSTRK